MILYLYKVRLLVSNIPSSSLLAKNMFTRLCDITTLWPSHTFANFMMQYHRVGLEYLSVTRMEKSRFDLFAYSSTIYFGIPNVHRYSHHISVRRCDTNQSLLIDDNYV